MYLLRMAETKKIPMEMLKGETGKQEMGVAERVNKPPLGEFRTWWGEHEQGSNA